MKNLAVKKTERTVEFKRLRPLNVYPNITPVVKELRHYEEKQGQPLVTRNALEIKVNQLYKFIEDFEASVPFDEDVQFCLDCIRDHASTLASIAEDYHHFSERAA